MFNPKKPLAGEYRLYFVHIIIEKKARYLVLFAERVEALIPFYVSFAGIRCIKDAVLLHVS